MNILIVDDDSTICTMVEGFVNSYIKRKGAEYAVNIRCFERVGWLLSWLDSGNMADIVFMDIKLQDANGIDLVRKIQEINSGTAAVFMTGYIEYAPDIFKAKPFCFLVKPITQDKVDDVMDKVIRWREEENGRFLSFKADDTVWRISKRDIYYIEADKKNIKIHMKDRVYRVSVAFKDMEMHAGDIMIKCHRSYMVNPEKVRKCDRSGIELISGEVIPVSRSMGREVCAKICMRDV